jgi:hypothetical protein
VPAAWVTAAQARLAAAVAAGEDIAHLSSILSDDLLLARETMCAGLGWRRPSGGADNVVLFTDLTVAAATQLQRLRALEAIAPRHAACVASVRAFDGLPAAIQLPQVQLVLSRWWCVRGG